VGLEKCLYCDKLISDSTNKCPYCDTAEPHNTEKHAAFLSKKESEVIKKRYLSQVVNCRDCGKPTRLEEFWQSKNEYSCPSCGYSGFSIKCSSCDLKAQYFDEYQNAFVCSQHNTEKCCHCYSLVRGEEKKYEASPRGTLHPICTSCYNKKKTKEFWQDFPVAYLLRPIGFGFVYIFPFLIAGFIANNLLLDKLLALKFIIPYKIIGVLGFVYGFVWAIKKKEYMD